MSQQVKVGISDLNVVRAPDSLVTFALGSCVGICLYDRVTKVAGLSHIMLPVNANHDAKQVYRFADTALPVLVQKMVAMGAAKARLTAKIAGGASMFSGMPSGALSHIGERNVAAVREALAKLGIPIVANDTGKNYGRTVYLYADTGVMQVKSANKGEWNF